MDTLDAIAKQLDGTLDRLSGPNPQDVAFLSVDFDRAADLVDELVEHGVYLLERNLLSPHRYSAAAQLPDGMTSASVLQVHLDPPVRHAAIGSALAARNLDEEIRKAHGGEAPHEPLREIFVRVKHQPASLSDMSSHMNPSARHVLVEHLRHKGRHNGEYAPFGQRPDSDPVIDTLATLLEDALPSVPSRYSAGVYKTHAMTLADRLELLDVARMVNAPRKVSTPRPAGEPGARGLDA